MARDGHAIGRCNSNLTGEGLYGSCFRGLQVLHLAAEFLLPSTVHRRLVGRFQVLGNLPLAAFLVLFGQTESLAFGLVSCFRLRQGVRIP
jgi:hypothetical protein